MRKFQLHIFSAALAASVLLSCNSMSSGPQPSVPLTKQQIEALAARAKEPQLNGIIIYPSENGPVFGGVWHMHESEVAAINFPAIDSDRAPIVSIGTADDRLNALLDTSSPLTWATLPAMAKMDIKLIKSPTLLGARPTHVYNSFGGFLGVASHLNVDQISIGNALFYVLAASGPLGTLSRGLDSANISVVFGVDMLKAFNHVQFNFPAQHVVLSASSDYQPSDAKLLASIPLIVTNSGIVVAGSMDGSPTNFVIDTGGDYAIALPPGRPAGKIQQVSLDDLVMRDLPGVPGSDLALGQITMPRIGRQALARFKMTLDFRAKKIHFEKP